MPDDPIVFMNGDFKDWNDATAHMMCHSFGRGSAIFEVLSFHKTEAGSAVFRLDEHIKRLFRTAELLDMELPMTRKEVQTSVLETVRRNTLKEGAIKIIGYYSQLGRGILPLQKKLDIAIFVWDMGGPAFSTEQGTTLCVSKWRKLDPQTVPIEAKAAANYLNGMMARKEAEERGFENALMLDTQGFVAEGGTESVFLVKKGVLLTPALGTILQGITRKSLLQAAQVVGLESRERRLTLEEFLDADEIFLSGTSQKVLPVKKIEDQSLGNVPGPLSQKCLELMADIVAGRDRRFKEWLFHVR